MKAVCHLDGEVLPLSEARIDPLDRGFLFGDALYEVVKVRSGRLFELGLHLERLDANLERTGIRPVPELERACRDLVAAAELDTGFLYLQITRGVAPRTHLPPPGLEPTVFILPATHEPAPPASRRLRAVTQADRRWGRCNIKTTSLIATVLGKIDADERGADENLLVAEDGSIREGGQTNFFVRRNDVLETHPTGRHILPGVTRHLVVRFIGELGLPLNERAPRVDELAEWQEAFVCGTLTGVQPVVEVDGTPVADGEAGEWTRRLAEANEAYELECVAGAEAQASVG